jgi:hypothetical protein
MMDRLRWVCKRVQTNYTTLDRLCQVEIYVLIGAFQERAMGGLAQQLVYVGVGLQGSAG